MTCTAIHQTLTSVWTKLGRIMCLKLVPLSNEQVDSAEEWFSRGLDEVAPKSQRQTCSALNGLRFVGCHGSPWRPDQSGATVVHGDRIRCRNLFFRSLMFACLAILYQLCNGQVPQSICCFWRSYSYDIGLLWNQTVMILKVWKRQHNSLLIPSNWRPIHLYLRYYLKHSKLFIQIQS